VRLDIRAAVGYDECVRFYGVLDHEAEIIDLHLTRESAQEDLERLLRRDPAWRDKVELVLVDFMRLDPVIECRN
jgi:hypothetical protein